MYKLTRHAAKVQISKSARELQTWLDSLYKIMKTYEPARSSAYIDELRWRIVYQMMALGYTFDQNLGVDELTAQRTVARLKTAGNVHKRPYPKRKGSN